MRGSILERAFLCTPFDRFLLPPDNLILIQMRTKIPVFPYLENKRKFTFAENKNPEEKEEEEEERESRKTMFYSQCLLSSKGPLGAIWVAGYFFKRLKKRQVTDTDISSSVGLFPFSLFLSIFMLKLQSIFILLVVYHLGCSFFCELI